jgi:hypothetical protein
MDPASCGPGLAHNAALPQKLGDLMAAMAEILELHRHALNLTDAGARHEHEAYTMLVGQQRTIAAELVAIARAMTGYRDLPPAKHDEKVLSAPSFTAAFERFVTLKQELRALLEQEAESDRQMLEAMRGT